MKTSDAGGITKINPAKSTNEQRSRFLTHNRGNVRLLNDDMTFPGPVEQTSEEVSRAKAAAEAKRAARLAKRRA